MVVIPFLRVIRPTRCDVGVHCAGAASAAAAAWKCATLVEIVRIECSVCVRGAALPASALHALRTAARTDIVGWEEKKQRRILSHDLFT